METLSFALSLVGFFAAIAPNLIKGKNMKLILFFLVCANTLYALSYLAGGSGINGSISGFLGAAIAGSNYIFESRNRNVPYWMIGIYCVAFTSLHLIIGGFTLLSLISILAALAFVLGIIQKNGKLYRVWALANIILWVVYDICSKSWEILPVHSIQLISVFVGMFLHDRKKTV